MKFPSFKFFLITTLVVSSDCGLAQAIICCFLKASYTIMLATAVLTGELDQDMVDKVVRTCGPQAAFGPLNDKLKTLYHLRKDAENVANQLFNIKFDFKKTLLDKEQLIFSNDFIDVTAKLSMTASGSAETSKDALLNVKAGEVTDKDGAKLSSAADSVSDSIVSKIEEKTGFNIKDMTYSVEKKIGNLDGKFKVTAGLDKLNINYSTSKQVGQAKIDESMTYEIKRNPKAQAQASQAISDFQTSFKKAIEPITSPIPLAVATVAGMATLSRMTSLSPSTSLAPAAVIAPIVTLFGAPKF